MVEFKAWPKIARIATMWVTITEKIDGTNGCIIVQDGKVAGVQSRKRLIDRENDNMGFANWVYDNEEELAKLLGEGYHYGEWAGPGVQKNPHDLPDKMFFLFNVFREDYPSWVTDLPISPVPTLYTGPYSKESVETAMQSLLDKEDGLSTVIGGSGSPEGIIIYFHNFKQHMKLTIRDPEGKWKTS